MTRIWPGRPEPLGATWDGEGVNFALFSQHAEAVELCLFDSPESPAESARILLREHTDGVWHTYLPDAKPGRLYGYRVYGPYDPERGHRFNHNKLLLDPYALAITGEIRWSNQLFGYNPDDEAEPSLLDSVPAMPRCVVVDTAFTWGEDRRPRTPWNRTVIYECHVRGMTMNHPDVPEGLRGTYLGLGSDPILDHLTSLGVTAVELLPIHQSASERELVARGLVNYWGYNSVSFFAPDVRYAKGRLGRQVQDFKSMVKTLHRAGIEVLLDVVYNHTAEGGHLGPTLSFRGIDNSVYYRLVPGDERRYVDTTGCGNSVDTAHPRVLQMVMDSLRYWVTEMHVDGFRFDLAPTLARDRNHVVDMSGTFFQAVMQDRVLSKVKLIAEPWDAADGGYRLGEFPARWAEWNGKYRDTARRFWRGDQGQVPDLASGLSGSSDLFGASGRGTYASVNFVTAHDGFTLNDLVSYEKKHNEANGEDNQDGPEDDLSRNWGSEGETESTHSQHMRERMKRNLLATLLFSQGVPMLLGGDELGRTQVGNNNAYCQDNEVSWLDWNLSAADRDLFEFTRTLIRTFRANPVLRRRAFFSGTVIPGAGVKDVTWIRSDGTEMTDTDWTDAKNHVLGMLIDSRATDEVDARGRPVFGDTVLLLVNGGARSRVFSLPKVEGPGVWLEEVNTARAGTRTVRGPALNLVAHSLMLLRYGDPF